MNITINLDTPLISSEELYDLGNKQRMELIKGKINAMSPTGFLHGEIELNIGSLLRQFVSQKQLGRVMTGEVGIYIQRNPDTIRGADVLYVSHQRLQEVKSKSYLDVTPELIVEVLSPRDRWADMQHKLEDYFSINVDRVWIADPNKQQLHVYTSLTQLRILKKNDMLKDETILPGFQCKVAAFFE